ncbi:MAG TPA: carboxypeptidase regulatory-like domain-containing protein, partial [Blastocatellia bacterium]|nr:carboxypeptidase regulatory-like domain-containing protein [Blastocatellia bacterium]
YDQNGAVIPEAAVLVKHKETGLERTSVTDEDGRYRAVLLPLGTYTVEVSKAGFGRLIRENIEVTVGRTINLPLTLQPATASETVTVTAEAPIVETTRAETATLVNERSVENLPTNGRDFVGFIKLAPTVSIVQGPDGAEITINGQKGIQNNISIDGADANNPFFGEQRGGQRPQFTISLESVKEFQVVTDGGSAEFGRSSGGFINVVTKSGTNEFHGSGFLFFRDEALTSQNPDAVAARVPTEDFRQYQFGGSFGGPIKRNKAFFFLSFDQSDANSSKANRIDPRLVNIFATRFNSPGEQGIIERTNDATALLGKLDWNITSKNLLTVRHNYSRAEQVNGTFDVPTWGRSANGRETDNSNAFITQLVTTFSARLLNEFRFQYAREERPRFYDGPDLPDVAIGGTDPETGEPTAFRFGRPFFLPVPETDERWQFTNNFSILRGSHSIKMGFDFNRTKTSQTFVGFGRGRYIFASVEAFEAYLDNPANFGGLLFYLQFAPLGGRTVEEAGTQEFTQLEPEWYVQDKWQPRPNLTISYGLRYYAQIQDQPILPLAERRYAQFVGRPDFPSDGTIPSEKKGWQPRFGLAWDPGNDSKMVIRANAGIYYARVPGLVLAGPRNTDGAISGSIFTCCGLPFLPTPPADLGIFTDTASFVPFNPGVRVFAKDFRNPRTLQWGLSIEREVAKDLTLSAGFNYANSVHLTRFVNRNTPSFIGHFAPDGRKLFDGPQPFALPDGSGIGELATTESSARSLYRGFVFTAAKRFSHRFQFQANYVLSWDYADDDNERDPFTFRYADVTDFGPEYGYSDRDQRHRFNAFGVFQLPYDVIFTTIFQARSAQPDSVLLPADANLDGNFVDRPFVNGVDIGRNTTRKKNQFYSFDFRLSRVFKFGENVQLEPLVEVFNLFNNTNQISVPRPLLQNFDGTVRSGFGDPRQAQLGVKLRF